MRLPLVISRYLLREVLQYTGLGLATITIIFVSQHLLRYMDDLIAAGLPLSDFAAISARLVPMLLAYTLPIAFLFGVLLALGRMAGDSEVLAMRACGVGLRSLVVPVVGLGFAISCMTWYLVLEVEHRARRELRTVVRTIAARGAMIEPGRFRKIGDRVLFVRERDVRNRLMGILISDRSDPERPLMIFAEHGRFALDEERGEVKLRLENGDIHLEPTDDEERYQHISFQSFDYAFDVSGRFADDIGSVRPYHMSMQELRSVLARAEAGDPLSDLRKRNPEEYRLQIHRRLALPFAPTLFALVGVPLGMRRVRGARSWGVLVCTLLAFLYYLILSFSQYLALESMLPAAAAIWLPNAAFALAAVVLLARARRPGG